jgi:hypothetical protein
MTNGGVVGFLKGMMGDVDGPIRCSSLTLQREEHQRKHGKLIKQ